MESAFLHIDCNNFYYSCQAAFNAKLKGKAVVVMSNNDSTVIARSPMAKKIGIKMGQPIFQIQDVIKSHGVILFSANYALYADMSNRVMSIIESESAEMEVYSLDEAFLSLQGFSKIVSLYDFGKHLKDKVTRCTGIGVGVGIAPTKTLAKVANYGAKNYPATGGIVNLMSAERQRKLMALMDVKEVWGVGSKHADKLRTLGIFSALELADAPPALIKANFSVVMQRTVMELNGVSCLPLEMMQPESKQIVSSRTFGKRVSSLDDLRAALADFTSIASKRLRSQKQVCKLVTIFIASARYDDPENYTFDHKTTKLTIPISDTGVLISIVNQMLSSIFRVGVRYAKGGVMLMDLQNEEFFQQQLIETQDDKSELSKVMDEINEVFSGGVKFGVQNISDNWVMRRSALSPNYTTQWDDIPICR